MWIRSSVSLYMMDHAGVHCERVELSPPWFILFGKKQMHGSSLPIFERTDGTFMNETVPVNRYIARHNGYWPTNPRECYDCDYIVE
jgi:hypothetical protein